MSAHRALLALAAALSFAAPALAAPAAAAPPGKPAPKSAESPRGPAKTALVTKERSRHAPVGKSIGSPTDGRLLGGAHLAEGPHLRIVPQYAATDVRWGLEALVGVIDRAARSVRRRHPDAVLSVGHLSRAGGGELDRHASHESGRDADVAFYVRNHLGKAAFAEHFVPFSGDGTAKTWPGAHFDDEKNWAFVAALLEDRTARVSHLFVATPLRARLLAYAEKIGAPRALRQRAAEVMAQPRGALPHDDHFHVRIECPHGMDKCIEQPALRAKRPARHGAAVASTAHPSAPTVTTPTTPAAPSSPAAPAPHEPAARSRHETASAAPPAPPAKEETSFPSFAQAIPGLDEAIIAAPLSPAAPSAPASPAGAAPAAPEVAPISDPDGVLE